MSDTQTEEERDAERQLRTLIDKMQQQKSVDEMEYCKEVVDVLEHLGIYSTVAQVWQDADGKTSLVYSVVVPLAGLEDLKKLVARAVMADLKE